MYPLKFKPIYKEKVWGGNKLKYHLNKDIPENVQIGESWEICSFQNDSNIVENGDLKGKSIESLIKGNKEDLLGSKFQYHENEFPLLIKFIDAKEKLSVQVHPDDKFAKENENSLGKTEMWYVLEADPGAKLIYGLRKGITSENFIEVIKEDKLEEYLYEVNVKAGDVLFIPSGTIHAIEEGILIAEIQQSSDITYRVYDWKRSGLDGKPRQLHIEKAKNAINFEKDTTQAFAEGLTLRTEDYLRTIYAWCEYFTVELIEINSIFDYNLDGKRFEILICVDGDLEITYHENEIEKLSKGETVLLPASLGELSISGRGKILRTYISDYLTLINELQQLKCDGEEINKISGLKDMILIK